MRQKSLRFLAKAILLTATCGGFAAFVVDRGHARPENRIPPGRSVSASAEIYTRHCAECHGRDGRARTAKGKRTGATDFTSGEWNSDEARAIRIISNGRVEMPAFKRKLSKAEIRSVWRYVLRFRRQAGLTGRDFFGTEHVEWSVR